MNFLFKIETFFFFVGKQLGSPMSSKMVGASKIIRKWCKNCLCPTWATSPTARSQIHLNRRTGATHGCATIMLFIIAFYIQEIICLPESFKHTWSISLALQTCDTILHESWIEFTLKGSKEVYKSLRERYTKCWFL